MYQDDYLHHGFPLLLPPPSAGFLEAFVTLYTVVIPTKMMWSSLERSGTYDANARRTLWPKSESTLILVSYVGLETLRTHQEKYDPFKNPQLVLFVYITQGATHCPGGVAKVQSFTPGYDNVARPRLNETRSTSLCATHDFQ